MMKENNNKVRAAICAAVMTYIAGQEEMAVISEMAESARGTSALEQGPFTFRNNWGIQGRQAQMQNRVMMQLKAFHR
ncbi:MAG: hypothetical protein AB1724_03025 [Thermodesulfobacteriota bacterium]